MKIFAVGFAAYLIAVAWTSLFVGPVGTIVVILALSFLTVLGSLVALTQREKHRHEETMLPQLPPRRFDG